GLGPALHPHQDVDDQGVGVELPEAPLALPVGQTGRGAGRPQHLVGERLRHDEIAARMPEEPAGVAAYCGSAGEPIHGATEISRGAAMRYARAAAATKSRISRRLAAS